MLIDYYYYYYYSLGGETAMPGGLYAKLCHDFLVVVVVVGRVRRTVDSSRSVVT